MFHSRHRNLGRTFRCVVCGCSGKKQAVRKINKFAVDILVPGFPDGIDKDLRWAEGPAAGPKNEFL